MVNLDAIFEDGLLPPSVSCSANRKLSEGARQRLVDLHEGRTSGKVVAGYFPWWQPDSARPRGYLTIDAARKCSELNPRRDGYFGGAGAVASQRNVLSGEIVERDGLTVLSRSPAVHIEAFPGAFAPGSATFYGDLLNNSAIDAREPLPTQYTLDIDLSDTVSAELLSWRGIGRPHRTAPVRSDTGQSVHEPTWIRESGEQGLRSGREFEWSGGAEAQTDPIPAFWCLIVGGVNCPPPLPLGLTSQRVPIVERAVVDPTLYEFQVPVSRSTLRIGLEPELRDFVLPSNPPQLQGWIALVRNNSGGGRVITPATPIGAGCPAVP